MRMYKTSDGWVPSSRVVRLSLEEPPTESVRNGYRVVDRKPESWMVQWLDAGGQPRVSRLVKVNDGELEKVRQCSLMEDEL